MESKDRKKLVERLERLFSELEMWLPPEQFNNGQDCAPPYKMGWHDFLNKLDDDGMMIINKKECK